MRFRLRDRQDDDREQDHLPPSGERYRQAIGDGAKLVRETLEADHQAIERYAKFAVQLPKVSKRRSTALIMRADRFRLRSVRWLVRGPCQQPVAPAFCGDQKYPALNVTHERFSGISIFGLKYVNESVQVRGHPSLIVDGIA